MIATKILLIEIALAVITVVHHASASSFVEICEYLIYDEGSFKRGEENGLENFQYAYKHLTINDIKKKFKFFPDDNVQVMTKKILQEKVMTAYYSYLFDRNSLKLYDMLLPIQWCLEKVKECIANKNFDREKKNEQAYIVGYLCTKEEANNGNRSIIFKSLYENWSYEKLQANIDYSKKVYTLAEEMPGIYTESYTLGYFTHVDKIVDDPKSISRNAKSIEYFCRTEGAKLLY